MAGRISLLKRLAPLSGFGVRRSVSFSRGARRGVLRTAVASGNASGLKRLAPPRRRLKRGVLFAGGAGLGAFAGYKVKKRQAKRS